MLGYDISSLKLVCCIQCMALEVQSKKGGPYSKQEQQKRRDEVFKLHFEYGYSATQIAEMLKINRNTINSDVSFLYSKLGDEMDNVTYGNWLDKQLARIESQRVRLRKELDNDITLQERLQVEKVILDLDSKISSLIIKISTSKQERWDKSTKFINNWMKKNGQKDRFMLFSDFLRIPEKSRKKIDELLNEK